MACAAFNMGGVASPPPNHHLWLPQRQISNARLPQTRKCLRHARGRNVERCGIHRIGTWGQTSWRRQRDHAREHCTLQRQHAHHTSCHICVAACIANPCRAVSHSGKLPPECARTRACNCLRQPRGKDLEPLGVPKSGTPDFEFMRHARDHKRKHCTLQRRRN